MAKSFDERLKDIIEDLLRRICENTEYEYRIIFASSETVCWELVYEENDDCCWVINITKWENGKSMPLASFHTGYCFGLNGPIIGNLGHLEKRLFGFFESEI